MKYRKLGNSDLIISEIGFGGWGIGGSTLGATSYGHTFDYQSLEALECAQDNGINFYDTSNIYGLGHSEFLIGKAFSKIREKVIIATKAGYKDFINAADFSVESISNSVDSSLRRLDTDYIDLLQLHNPTYELLNKNHKTIELLSEFQSNGKVRNIGISVKSPQDALSLIDLFPFQSIQVNFNMLDIRVIKTGLMEKAKQLNIGIIARTPLAFGFLSGTLNENTVFTKEDHRSVWNKEKIKTWVTGGKDILSICTELNINKPYEIAIQFCLSYPEISSVIVGMLSPQEVLKNIKASKLGALKNSSCLKIEQLHDSRSFF
jgi:aryl-alcohol dehydrogenase-like predicted oxidoreductase